MNQDMNTDTPWIKATASGGQGGDCVEMRRSGGSIEVRDTKAHGTGPSLRFTPSEWDAWLDGAKKGEYDHLS